MMGRHSPAPWWRRLWRRLTRRQAKPGIKFYPLEPSPDNRMIPIPTPLRDDWDEPTEAEVTRWVADITDPDLKLPPLDPPVAPQVALDETRFDLIRLHPYNPPRGTDETRVAEPGPAHTVGHGADGDSGSGVRLHPELHAYLPARPDPSPDGSIPADAPALRGLAHVRGWSRDASPGPERDQAPAAAGLAGTGGYRNPGS